LSECSDTSLAVYRRVFFDPVLFRSGSRVHGRRCNRSTGSAAWSRPPRRRGSRAPCRRRRADRDIVRSWAGAAMVRQCAPGSLEWMTPASRGVLRRACVLGGTAVFEWRLRRC